MKIIVASMFLVLSVSSFASVELGSIIEKREFDQYILQSSKAAKVTVKVDNEVRRVDCHGLDEKYSRDVLSTGEILISKHSLAHTMQMCGPGTDYVATSGISFTVTFKESYGGSQAVLVPANAKITLVK
jgi:hypothetical protein